MNSFDAFDFSTFATLVLVFVSIKVAVLALIVWGGAKLFHVRDAVTLHQAATFLLGAMLLMPALAFLVPAISFPLVLSVETAEATTSDPVTTEPRQVAIRPFPEVLPLARTTDSTAQANADALAIDSIEDRSSEDRFFVRDSESLKPMSWPKIVLTVYLLGASLMLVRLLIGMFQCSHLIAHSRRVELPGSKILVRNQVVFESDNIEVPSTVGILRPKIVLPPDWRQWNEKSLAMAIAHETRHIDRRDTLVMLMASINCALYWFHPLSWLLKRRLADLAEHVCDDAVIHATDDRQQYAHFLVQMATRFSGSFRQPLPVSTGMARTALVEHRVNRILDIDRALSTRFFPVFSAVMFCCVAFFAAFTASVGGFSVASFNREPTIAATTTSEDENDLKRTVLLPNGSPAAQATVFIHAAPSSKYKSWTTKTDAHGNVVQVSEEKGTVSVSGSPAITTLELSEAGAKDLSFLRDLPADAIDALKFNQATISHADLEEVVRLKSISKLEFSRCEFIPGAFEDLGGLPKLSYLNISVSGRNDLATWIANQTQLQTLFCSPAIQLEDLKSIGHHPSLATTRISVGDDIAAILLALSELPSLRELSVMANQQGLARQAVENLSRIKGLETLRWFNGIVDGKMLRAISNNQRLKNLTLFQIQLGEEFREGMKTIESLEKLDVVLADDDWVQAGNLQADAWIPTLGFMPNLREWPTLQNIDRNSLVLLSTFQRIESLILQDCRRNVENEDLINTLSKLTRLKRLELHSIPITDKGLGSLASIKSLEFIRLFDTDVTGQGFAKLSTLPSLREIYLFFGRFDDAYIIPNLNSLKVLTSLEHVDIAGPSFTPQDLEPLGDCKTLKKVRLWGGGFTDDSTAIRLAGLPHLEDLTLSDNCLITDAGAEALAKNTNIQRLAVSGFITKDGAQKLAALPALERLIIDSPSISPDEEEQLRSQNPGLPFFMVRPLRTSVVLGDDGLMRKKLPGEDLVKRGEDGLLRQISDNDSTLRARMDSLENKFAPGLLAGGQPEKGIDLTSLNGKVVLIDFWGTWCGPCRTDIKKLQTLYEKNHGSGLEIVGVHTSEGAEQLDEFVKEKNIQWTNIVDEADELRDSYNIEHFPSYFLIDRKGVLRVALVHPLGLEDAILKLLKEGE